MNVRHVVFFVHLGSVGLSLRNAAAVGEINEWDLTPDDECSTWGDRRVDGEESCAFGVMG